MEELCLPVEEIQAWTRDLYLFLNNHRDITSAHSVDFFTCNHWENIIKSSWREDLLTMSCDEQLIKPSTGGPPGSLKEFLQNASVLRLQSLVSRPDQFASPPECSSILNFGMKKKKCYEVDLFSKHVNHLTSQGNIKQVIDLGSGKGYLSEQLALQYGLTVVGVDAQEVNTIGAKARNKKVHKIWKIHKKENKDPMVKDNVVSMIPDNDEEDVGVAKLFNSSGGESCLLSTPDDACKHKFPTCAMKEGIPTEILAESNEDLQDSYYPLTMELHVNSFDRLLQQSQKISHGAFNPQEAFCIVGLHTCGDLAAHALRYFVHSPTARAMSVVGCCYNHITERNEGLDVDLPGFPLSLYLKSFGVKLGRATRMLACQAISRSSTITSGDSLQVIFWRSVLQVVIKCKFPELYKTKADGIIVGRFRHKPSDFLDYVRAAATRTELDMSNVTDDEVLNILAEYQQKEAHLKRFLLVRNVLAPCIETLLMLDRLLFLQEQDPSLDISLVDLFRPDISPRCTAITARRRH